MFCVSAVVLLCHLVTKNELSIQTGQMKLHSEVAGLYIFFLQLEKGTSLELLSVRKSTGTRLENEYDEQSIWTYNNLQDHHAFF